MKDVFTQCGGVCFRHVLLCASINDAKETDLYLRRQNMYC